MSSNRSTLGGGCIRSLLLIPFVFLMLVCLLTRPMFDLWLTFREFHDNHPREYRTFAAEFMGLNIENVTPGWILTEEGRRAAEQAGLDPETFARALATQAWADMTYGENEGDWTIYYTLTSGESGLCQNTGNFDAESMYIKRGWPSQVDALHKFLRIWKKWDIRTSNPLAAEQINPSYTTAKGSSAGALGCSQFLAGTAMFHLDAIGEPFDLWDKDTAMKAMAAELHRLGWHKDKDLFHKIQVLLGWNGERWWVTTIAEKAEAFRLTIGQYFSLRKVEKTADDIESSDGFKRFLLKILGLLPEPAPSPEQTLPGYIVDPSQVPAGDIVFSHGFSISAQSWGDPEIIYNIRKIVADKTVGNPRVYDDFTGALRLDPRPSAYSINLLYGPYNYGSGYHKALGVEGGGACNFSGLAWYVLAKSGMRCRATDPTHPVIPGVPAGYWPYIWYGSKDVKCSFFEWKDEAPIYLVWNVHGDRLDIFTVRGER